jgi:hypothetical protein
MAVVENKTIGLWRRDEGEPRGVGELFVVVLFSGSVYFISNEKGKKNVTASTAKEKAKEEGDAPHARAANKHTCTASKAHKHTHSHTEKVFSFFNSLLVFFFLLDVRPCVGGCCTYTVTCRGSCDAIKQKEESQRHKKKKKRKLISCNSAVRGEHTDVYLG